MKNELTKKEFFSYGFAGLGQNIVYLFSSTFLMIFYTDIFKIKPATVGLLFLVARIWDACNDFIMGAIADNTRTRWGKLRPYLLFAPLPIAILTILTFSAPDFTYTLKVVYIYVTYILWGMAYTVGDIPYWGLQASMTRNSLERTKLITFTRLMTMIGTAIGIVGIPLLLDFFSKGEIVDSRGYLITAIIVSVIGCGLFSLAFFNTKERIEPPKEKTSLKENLKLLKTNIPLLIVALSSLLGFSRFMAQSAGTYVTKYNLQNEKLFALLGGVLMLSVIIAIVLTPLLLKYFSKRNLYILTSLFGALMYFVMFFVGYNNLILILIFLFLSSLSMGFFNVLFTAFIADSVDYLEWKTGKRAEGLCYAMQTFFFKLSAALTGFTMSLVLTYTGFVENDMNQAQIVYDGIYSLVSLIPGIGCLLSIIPMLFYKFTDNDQKFWISEINKRKEGI